MKSNYNERKERRIERFKELAAKNEATSEQQFKRASKMASVIPLGQPILVGHHSEKRDRNYRNRIDNIAHQGVESGKKAKYYEEKANVAENNTAISSDDPDAITKLKSKLTEMQEIQRLMKDVNKLMKRKDLSNEAKATELIKLNILNNSWHLIDADNLKNVGFAKFQLQNNNQNIARVKKRTTELESMSKMESSEVMIGDTKIKTNVEDNRLQIFFLDKPNETVRKELKRHGFRWSPSVGAWQRQISNMASYYAHEIVANMNKPHEGE